MMNKFPILKVPPHLQGQRWSRTQSAMGGRAIWDRWVQCPMAVIGVGRNGSLMAEALIRSGVLSLSLIDPDLVEPHNLAEMALLDDTDIGKTKAQAIAERLLTINAKAMIRAIVTGINDTLARQVAAAHPVLWQCVDNDPARMQGGLIATAYHRVLVDIATGVHKGEPRRIGADIRLIVPGDGCLMCRGGLSQGWAKVLDGPQHSPDSWREQRAGSLRSLNQIAIGLGLRLLEDLFAERLTQSSWLHLEFTAEGLAQISYPLSQQQADCPLCRRSGNGDALYAWPD